MERASGGPATVTINRNDRFIVAAADGTIDDEGSHGFFAADTRFVSGYRIRVNGRPPTLLGSAATDFFASRFEFDNSELLDADGPIPPASLSIRLDRTIAGGVHEDLDIESYARRPVALTLEIEIESDFADIFDVVEPPIVRRGTIQRRWFESRSELRTSYVNGDFRRSLVMAVEQPDSPPRWADGRLSFALRLAPRERWHACLRWLPLTGGRRRPVTLECNAITKARAGMKPPRPPRIGIETPNRTVEAAWRQAVRDLEALRLEDGTPGRTSVVPAAGIPWYATLFGRDSLIASMQSIAGYPEFAAGALLRLSDLQATGDDPARDMEPGKIPHEIRQGELATLGLRPQHPYYGTHDATSLFVIVLSHRYHWTGDVRVLERYLPAAEAAMAWIDHHGDRDGDGFQEYGRRAPGGFANQGWKDATDAIVDAMGEPASLPIATCELQGYAYDARLRLAEIHDVLGNAERAGELRAAAARLYDRVNDAFWWEREGTYALALDGRKRQVRSVASNAGHLLLSGIVPPDRARRVADRLLADDMWSGWGIRTLSAAHPYYNPLSYHTGSVWPHDNAMIAAGLRRYGLDAEAARVAKAIFDAAAGFPMHRLPELWSGLLRDGGAVPVPYRRASAPQAWAAASVLQLVMAMCGIDARVSADGGRALYVDPALPDWLPALTITNLRAGRGVMDLGFRDGSVDVLANTTGYRVIQAPAPRPEPPG